MQGVATRGQKPSGIELVDPASGLRVAALAHARIECSSAGLGWAGLHLEAGVNGGWRVDELSFSGHYLALNRARIPIEMTVRTERGWRSQRIGPGELWLAPVDQPFSLRVAQTVEWAGVVIAADWMRDCLGRDWDLPTRIGLADPHLAALIRALIEEAGRRGAAGARYAARLAEHLATSLALAHGGAAGARRGLSRARLLDVLDWTRAHLGPGLSVAVMAQRAGLSAGEFARAFRASTGTTPWAYSTHCRLVQAALQLESGRERVCVVAADCGFADEAHLCRAFGAHYGISPGRFARLGRREARQQRAAAQDSSSPAA